MDFLLSLVDLFNETAKKIAGYLPQSGADLLVILKKIMILAGNMDVWIGNNIGIDLKSVFPLFNKYSQPICPLPFVPYVAWNGDLKACCYMPIASEYSLGNVFTSSFNKVWHNKKNRYLRTELLHNRLLPFCHDCTLNNNS